MFVRKIKNPNGKTYIQVIDKSAGKYKVLKNIGSSSNEEEIKTLIIQGKNWINKELGVQEIDFTNYQQQMEDLFSLITE
ncbi:MAG: transposase, partial [Candidatus Delongbacteria bacterium]